MSAEITTNAESITQIIVLAAYKITSLLVGLTVCYFGYKLFLAGVWGNAGDMNAQFNNNKIVLKSAAPGTFFVLFGAIIISITIGKGLNMVSETTETKAVEDENLKNLFNAGVVAYENSCDCPTAIINLEEFVADKRSEEYPKRLKYAQEYIKNCKEGLKLQCGE